jgi:dUTP pyrophosphatase
MEIKIHKLDENAIIPTYGSDGSACLDLYTVDAVIIRPGDVRYIRSGWAFSIPKGYEVQIYPRSGIACKKQLIILNSPCIIDSDYRGEVYTYMKNISTESFMFRQGDRYAQMAIRRSIPVEFDVVDELDKTERGEGGFGSTGT